MLDENLGKPINTGVSGLLGYARNDGEKSYSSKIWQERAQSRGKERARSRGQERAQSRGGERGIDSDWLLTNPRPSGCFASPSCRQHDDQTLWLFHGYLGFFIPVNKILNILVRTSTVSGEGTSKVSGWRERDSNPRYRLSCITV